MCLDLIAGLFSQKKPSKHSQHAQNSQPSRPSQPPQTSSLPQSSQQVQPSQIPSQAQFICALCANIPWLGLKTEDVPAHPHQASLDALILSAQTCKLCHLVLHAAVSNYRRSDKDGQRWRRYEQVATMDQGSTTTRTATYAKELGQCMPDVESDLCDQSRGGCFATGKFGTYWATLAQQTVMIATAGLTGTSDEEPVEGAPLDIPLLRRQIPSGYATWLYGNFWAPKGTDVSQAQFVGVGARFGTSGHMFDAINNPERDVLIRGSALSVLTLDGMPFL